MTWLYVGVVGAKCWWWCLMMMQIKALTIPQVTSLANTLSSRQDLGNLSIVTKNTNRWGFLIKQTSEKLIFDKEAYEIGRVQTPFIYDFEVRNSLSTYTLPPKEVSHYGKRKLNHLFWIIFYPNYLSLTDKPDTVGKSMVNLPLVYSYG